MTKVILILICMDFFKDFFSISLQISYGFLYGLHYGFVNGCFMFYGFSERPEAPLSVVIISVDSTSIEIQPTPRISDHSSIIHWIVEAERRQFSTSIPQWKEFSVSPGSTSMFLSVGSFQPDTEYRLRVSAENVAGRSAATEPSDWFRTASAAPSFPPEKVVVRPLNATAVVATWTVGGFM